MQRASCTFGLNASPTQVELDLVPPNNPATPYDISVNATGWIAASGKPGIPLRTKIGGFDFVGLITAWTYNYGPQGFTYNVKTSDPRIIFDQVQISCDGQGVATGIYIPNYFNIFNYYSNPKDADLSTNGITFSKVRDFMSATGVINAWGNKFICEFSSGFLDATGTNVSGVPTWYRVNAGIQSFTNILQSVSKDLNIDYYAYIKPTTYAFGNTNVIRIQDIPRREVGDNLAVSGFITNARNSGVLLNYQQGQELRLEPNTTVLYGPPREYWPTINTSDVECVWGVTDKGTLVTTALTASSGIVLLDHINVSGIPAITSEVSVNEITFIKGTGVTYPPTIERVFYSRDLPGYQVSENILRAALHNKDSWEAMVFMDNTPFAVSIGITGSPYVTPAAFNNLITNKSWAAHQIGIKSVMNWKVDSLQQGADTFDAYAVSALQNEVYEATRRVAENYYGRQWLVRVGSSEWLAEGTYNSTDLTSYIEFTPTQFGWSEPNKTQFSGVLLNWPNMQGATSATFKDELGKTVAFLGVPNSRTAVHATNFPYPVDLSVFNKRGFILETDGKIAVPLSVQQYIKYPTKALVQLDTPIQSDDVEVAPTYIVDRGSIYVSAEQRPFYDFLKAVGFTNTQIKSRKDGGYAILEKADTFGLAPRRLHFNVPISASQYGFFVPVAHNLDNFGTLVATGTVPGGVNLVADSSYAPWMYGSTSGMMVAGSGTINKANNPSQYVDFGSFNIAGLPVFNIGEAFGANSIISSLSFQFSIEGCSTAYALKSYNYQPVRLTQLIQDKQPFIRGFNSVSTQEQVDIKDKAKDDPDREKRPTNKFETTQKDYLMSRV